MSRRPRTPALLLLSAFLAGEVCAQTMAHPCDDRTSWAVKTKRDNSPISAPEGLFFAAAFDFLALQADKYKAIPSVSSFFDRLDVSADKENSRDKAVRADGECVASPDQNFFIQCDAVLNRAYLGVSKISPAQGGRWLAPPEKAWGKPAEATLKQAREALTLVCDQFDNRRQAYAKRLRRDADLSAANRIVERRRAKAAEAAPPPAPPPAYEEASMISLPAPAPTPTLAPDVDAKDPRLQSNECRHSCEAYLAFGSEGCFSGLDASMKRWCEQKYDAVKAGNCVCR